MFDGIYVGKALQLKQAVAWESLHTKDDTLVKTRVELQLSGGLLTILIDDTPTVVGLPPEVSDAIVDMFAARMRFSAERRNVVLAERALALADQLRPEAVAAEIDQTKQSIAEHDELLAQHGEAEDLRQVVDSLRANLRMLETTYATLRQAEPVTRADLAQALQKVTSER